LSMGRGPDFVDSFSYSGVDVCPHKVVLYKVLFLLLYDQMAHFLTGLLSIADLSMLFLLKAFSLKKINHIHLYLCQSLL
jgi:hypothetical protein